MPPLLCLDPVLLDHSFPRSDEELETIATAFGRLQELVDLDEAHLILTRSMENFVDFFEWTTSGSAHHLLQDLYNLIVQWLLQPNERIIHRNFSATELLHKIPCASSSGLLSEFWSQDVGGLAAHCKAFPVRGKPFIGIACPYLFADPIQRNSCFENASICSFPIVGDENFRAELDDAYEWVLPSDIHQKLVPFREARRNIGILGGVITRITASHHIVEFSGARSWPLDINTDPIPDRFLNELETITGYTRDVIKSALISGRMPAKRLKMEL